MRRPAAAKWLRGTRLIALIVAGLLSGLILKGVGHVLIALGVPDARTVVSIAHVMIVAFGVVTFVLVVYGTLLQGRRRRNARAAVRAAVPRDRGRGAARTAVDALASSGLAPGVACAMLVGNERWAGCAGSATDERPVDEHTVFDAGSLTKVFTGILLADMVERGEVALDDPLHRFLPELPAAAAGRVTLLDLATHSAGLPRIPPRLRRRLLAAGLTGRHRLLADPYADLTPEDVVAALAGARRARPNAGFQYSNLGFAALGLALSRAAEAPYEALVEQRVLEPLRLRETSFNPPEDLVRAQGHDRSGHPTPSWRMGAMAPAGGLATTVSDLLLFAQAAMAPGDTDLVTAMRSAQEPRRPASKGERVGLGWLTRRAGARDVVWHNGGTGGFGSCLAVDPKGPTAVGLLANGAHDSMLDDTCFALLEREAGADEPQVHPLAEEPQRL